MIQEIKCYEIWSVKCDPSVGHEYQKIRPSLVVQSDRFNKNSELFTLIVITTNLSNKIPDDIFLKKDLMNNLYEDSLLKVRHIYTYDKSRFVSKMGTIDNGTQLKIKQYLLKHFGLNE